MQLAHRRRRGAFRGPASERSRGAVLVEAAFVTPIFFMLVFAIMEIGLAMNDNLALAHSVRAGTRVASASGNDMYADYGIMQAVKREAAALPRRQIRLIVVYKAASFGAEPNETCRDGSDVPGTCNVYTVTDLDQPKSQWGCTTGLDNAWCPLDRDVKKEGGTDYVGVWIKIDHPWVTRMFGKMLTLTDQSVIRLEPRVRA